MCGIAINSRLEHMNSDFYVYIKTNWNNQVLYVGVTNDLKRRLSEHRQGLVDGFTKQYHIHKLIYYEHYGDVQDAIRREKEIKGWTRAKKNALITEANPFWKELLKEDDC